ncbi:flagellar biosynthesis protein FlhB [Endozoicomonas ascidiicola]|uniref:flagellar biosynthesis protein FlhB n=1 Tax=Endozoicomonas ascidiicola TaxID=1698521 RepID=UPI000835203E|nr:flagellar biosynthesis protein FlhB [Endozoicomonas ascidiicola]
MTDSTQERTEQPSEKRRRESREKGQIPRSKELVTGLTLLSGSAVLYLMAGTMVETMEGILRLNLALSRETVFAEKQMGIHLHSSLRTAFTSLSPFFITLVITVLVGSVALGGWVMSPSLMSPKFSRINPAQWFGKVFSMASLMELLKSILKVGLVIGCLLWLLYDYYPLLLSLSRVPLPVAFSQGLQVLAIAMIAYASTLGIIALIDAPWQLFQHNKKIMMTKEEVKEEFKSQDGKPEVKARVRQLQREAANRRMMQKVPEADVIITNPTHYAIALRYAPEKADAPFVIAKGSDETALKIREIAAEHKVAVIEAPLLARAIFYTTKIDQEIPGDLYMAVAQILAYVQQLKYYRQGDETAPPVMPTLNIPDGYESKYQAPETL